MWETKGSLLQPESILVFHVAAQPVIEENFDAVIAIHIGNAGRDMDRTVGQEAVDPLAAIHSAGKGSHLRADINIQ